MMLDQSALSAAINRSGKFYVQRALDQTLQIIARTGSTEVVPPEFLTVDELRRMESDLDSIRDSAVRLEMDVDDALDRVRALLAQQKKQVPA